MSKLSQLLKEVHEENLTKERLDEYFSQLSLLRADVKIELSGLQKERAMFILQNPEKSIAQREAEWRGLEKGQREIELKAYISALKDALESVKTRIYSLL